ncbi:DDE-type integrase/transposase/recombinase [Methylomonas koyamae]|uniref:DDE-type integrase/transposase/recombinase n=1 Tax=Methylomonas koyamae TaxID=702114 RepID=UPI0028732C47|nr:DDE-type integrase/transposase/recombinase [Methylomonas koyamae]WNB74022.1 DDE-type integrase/transposase/recombinase [Methylomonas koyamae]
MTISRANQVWALDTTYIPLAKGFAYLTAVVDRATRKVLAGKVAITLEASHAVDMLEQAFKCYGRSDIINTEQCSQFNAKAFVDAVKGLGCLLSMNGRGAWRDNVSLSGYGDRSNTSGFTCMPTIPSAKPTLQSWIISSGTTTNDRIPV